MMLHGSEWNEMTRSEFEKYKVVLDRKPFVIYPAPQGTQKRWDITQFTLSELSDTHVTIVEVGGHATYEVPLALIEFANTGVLRATRTLVPFNGSFV
jgi:hypothetical protein